MFAGMTNILGMATRSRLSASSVSNIKPVIIVDFSTISADMFNQPGYTKARITCVGPGVAPTDTPYNELSNGTGRTLYQSTGGAGGNCVTSIVTIKATDVLYAVVSNDRTVLKINSNDIVVATHGRSYGGDVGDSIIRGQVIGNYGGFPYRVRNLGGAVSGTPIVYENGNSVSKLWIRSSDGLNIRAGIFLGPGGGGLFALNDGQNPQSTGPNDPPLNETVYPPQKGFVVIEWGETVPF